MVLSEEGPGGRRWRMWYEMDREVERVQDSEDSEVEAHEQISMALGWETGGEDRKGKVQGQKPEGVGNPDSGEAM